MTAKSQPTDFAALLQRFFAERLIQQRNASPRTVESYRDTFPAASELCAANVA
jgi:hypothetical protein